MAAKPHDQKTALLDLIVKHLDKKLDPSRRAMCEHFIRHYYRAVSMDDLESRPTEELFRMATGHWDYASTRKKKTPKVRVYNPTLDEHGWESTHTIVEMVNDDMPFLVDSLSMVMNRHGLMVHLTIHPIFAMRRDAAGEVQSLLDDAEAGDDALQESIMHIEIDRQTEPERLKAIEDDVRRVLADVRASVEDWAAMRARCHAVREQLETSPPPLKAAEIDEGKRFLEWLEADHFTFLGVREYELVNEDGEDILRVVPGTGLGILRDGRDKHAPSFNVLPREIRARARAHELLIITKANSVATVHRPGYLDYIGIKLFNAEGEVRGEQRLLGLFTSSAYNKSPRDIPLLKQKVERVMARAELAKGSHAGKALMNIIETFPRDELFQASVPELYKIALGILQLQERQRTRLFMRRDAFGRFWSCLVFVPRDRYNTQIRERIQAILMDALGGVAIETQPYLSESVLARLHVIVRTKPGTSVKFDQREVEERLAMAVRSWQDELRDALVARYDEAQGLPLFHEYARYFPPAYVDDVTPKAAAFDVERFDQLEKGLELPLSLYKPHKNPEGVLRFKIFRRVQPIPLSEALPMLENMGLRVISERPYEVKLPKRVYWIQDFDMGYGGDKPLEEIRDVFQDAFYRIWRGDAENDGFNRLVLAAGLSWRQTTVLRAYCKYLLQTGLPFSQQYMEQTLGANPGIAALLVKLFEARFDPADRAKADNVAAACIRDIEAALESVVSLDEDRILRGFYGVVMATLRTNFYQRLPEGGFKSYMSFKFDPSRIPELPLPRPMYEIWVYSPRTEGVHLRGGKVARGGLRWSDRREDFRTEVLGLMKAQTVKNTLIVPVGAKGGFVVKRPPATESREALMEEVIACYRTFIRGMLDITDNLVDTELVPPKDVVRHDDDDPYLVVAADKGTATFSDIANAISAEYGFWLGDAFASGGSNGYDHKKMGITAKGAWESVRRHFREFGTNTQTDNFTVVGIGDMSGDVFGNGMLLSRHIRLLAAFDHRHIFLDPNPDPEKSFVERERLFALPRSSWADYDAALISKGGAVVPRAAKSVRISDEVQAWLGLETTTMTPQQLIKELLKAPVDLLWNGGIGTYVKASDESHAEVGDRANDSIRVNGKDLRSKVVGEGGNLGFTQRGRIEYAEAGGRLNTDFIDNSAGVDCSDHEVNIKILFNAIGRERRLGDARRNKMLAAMTEEVGQLVLRDNYMQTQAISIVEDQASSRLEEHAYLIRVLERGGRLNRALEFLPGDEEIAVRRAAGRGLTRPEISVLLAYAKITIYDMLLASDVPEDPYLSGELEAYFPERLRRPYREFMQSHRLRREIISTHITNSMVNRMGPTFAHRMQDETGAEASAVARAYAIAREVFDIRSVWRATEELDNLVPSSVQTAVMSQSQRLIKHATHWLLSHRTSLDIERAVRRFAPGIKELTEALPEVLDEQDTLVFHERCEQYAGFGVPQQLARRIASLAVLYPALDLVEVRTTGRVPMQDAATVYFRLGHELGLGWMRAQIELLPVSGHWHAIARSTMRDDLYAQQRALTAQVLAERKGGNTALTRLDAWLDRNHMFVQRISRLAADMKSAGGHDFATLSVALGEVRKLVQVNAD
ncbi:MAG: NAD-glutamate dehydrogenase [Gammaproteobacteria bacterium]